MIAREGTIFPIQTMDRRVVRWEDLARALTPVQSGAGGCFYKREDWFAPLGYGGINGGSFRNLLHLLVQQAERGARGILIGGSVLSPKIASVACIAGHLGLPCTVVIGAKPGSALKHPNVQIAARVGATFHFVVSGRATVLEAELRRLRTLRQFRDYAWIDKDYLPSGSPAADLAAFHALGAEQVRDLPSEATTLHIAAGSCINATSVLHGLVRYRDLHRITRVVLYGVGPDHLSFMWNRLNAIHDFLGWPARPPSWQRVTYVPCGLDYGERISATVDGIALHPTYEGKVMHARHMQPFSRGDLFWIIGSEPQLAPMAACLPDAPNAAVPAPILSRSILGHRSPVAQR